MSFTQKGQSYGGRPCDAGGSGRGLWPGAALRGNDTDKKAYAAVWEAISTLPEPERCALCSEGMRYHAPCLINLSTGEMDELTVYQPHPALFYRECRKLLAEVGLEGYVVVDRYDLDNVQAYPVRKGKNEVIRDHCVSVTSGQDGSWELCVVGLLK